MESSTVIAYHRVSPSCQFLVSYLLVLYQYIYIYDLLTTFFNDWNCMMSKLIQRRICIRKEPGSLLNARICHYSILLAYGVTLELFPSSSCQYCIFWPTILYYITATSSVFQTLKVYNTIVTSVYRGHNLCHL